jgi:hypothetical protein
MPTVDFVVESKISRSVRARQVEALFDVPAQDKARLHWQGDVPIEERDWNVGLVVGPSGCGKTTVARAMFGQQFHPALKWGAASVIDDVAKNIKVDDIAAAFSSVGFSTIPSWLRPYAVLSNGEKFRVDVARRLLELQGLIVVDEFTSVVDRQVAQVGSHAIQKLVRARKKQFVAVTCHYDVIEWLQPDWVLEPATMTFAWRSLRRRPSIDVEICRVDHSLWQLFAPYHYLTNELNKAAACFALFVNGMPVAFAGILHFAHPHAKNIKRISRVVTLPDWQGLGLAFTLIDSLGAAFKACGFRLRNYPAHPAFIRSHVRSPKWTQTKEAGDFCSGGGRDKIKSLYRPCATFEYIGDAMDKAQATALLSKHGKA